MPKGIKYGGRQKGTPNKTSGELKAMIQNALYEAGGIDYLVKQAKENPIAFLTLIGKILPKDLNHGGQKDNPFFNIAEALDEANARLEKHRAKQLTACLEPYL